MLLTKKLFINSGEENAKMMTGSIVKKYNNQRMFVFDVLKKQLIFQKRGHKVYIYTIN